MFEYNTIIYLLLLAVSGFVAYRSKWIMFPVVYFSLFFGCEVLEWRFNVPVWNQTERTATCYNWFEQYLEKNYDRNKDYSEGIFEDNYAMSLQEATQNKYAYIFDKLGLKPGMKLLDAGCGTGVWMEFCKKRGDDVVGLTLSKEQAKEVRKKGMDVHVADYRDRNPSFIYEFDRITALGSSEHISSCAGCLIPGVAQNRANEIRIETWKLFYQYLKPEGKCYLTLLTINDKVDWSHGDWFQTYILERHYGGFYSTLDAITDTVLPETGFDLVDIQDKTKDYHWSSVADKDHFGHWAINWGEAPFNKLFYIFKGLASDPFLIYHWMYYFKDTWMWQFGGYQNTPLTDAQVKQSPMLLKYFMLEK